MTDEVQGPFVNGLNDLPFRPYLVGVHGQIGHGKDTFCQHLAEVRKVHHMSFANPLKEALHKILGGDLKHYFGTQADKACPLPPFWQTRLQKGWEAVRPDQVDNPTKWNTYREALQLFGTEVGRNAIARDLWVWAVEWRIIEGYLSGVIGDKDLIVFADLRFENEATAIHEWGGHVFRIVNANLEREEQDLREHSLPGADLADFSGHASEKVLPDHLLTCTFRCESVEENRERAHAVVSKFYS